MKAMAASQNTLLASRSLSSAATGRRLLSRIAAPFSPKPRSLTEYYIRSDEPHRQYAPGDTLKGAVVVTVVKPIRITHLVVSLRGHVRVFKHGSTESAYLSDSFSTSGQGKRAGEYYGNGFASLFQDEVVLCGEGRLESGAYEFKFELDFPEKGLPSSIDFERGTISYTVTSILTRPTTISPTTSCDRKVHLVEVVDIGPLMQPKSQTITLEPIRRSHRAKERSRENKGRELPRPSQRRESSSSSVLQSAAAEERDAASRKSSDDVAEEPDSPVASEISGASAASGSTGSFRSVPNSSVSRSSTRGTKGLAANPTKTITTTIEILRSGCLAGDFLPVKIHVSHTKPIKSLHGVIITLYRQGRIDSHPALSPVRAGKQPANASEDYYPKSRSGLGGLSLSSAGSSSTFRKDLSQTFAPIIVNPRTLMAEVKASVKVPDEAFPTIASVPGGIISFRYYVEVVIDLNGKLPELETCLPRPGTVNTPSNYWRRGDQASNATDEGMERVLSALGGSIIDTDQVRREKSVVACLFEVLVGTKDSTRERSRRRSDHQRGLSITDEEVGGDDARSADQVTLSAAPTEADGYHHFPPQDTVPSYVTGHSSQTPDCVPIEIPPPEMENGDNIDEKTRIWNAEQRLLPSAPPDGQDAHSEGPQSRAPPSAPAMSDLLPAVSGPHRWAGPTTTSTEALGLASARQDPSTVSEDKQDLERQRLQAQASAPDDDGPSADELPDAAQEAQPPVLPSAPIITEDDENGRYGGYHTHGGTEGRSASNTSRNGEHLPRYER